MFGELLNEDVAFYLYLGCFLFGLFFAVVSAILGGVFSTDMGGADVDVGGIDADANIDITADSVALSPLSPTVICVFLGVFGGVGLICLEAFKITVFLSGVIAVFAGIAVSVLFFTTMSWMMMKVQGSMSLSPLSIVGGQAEVSVAIPKDGLGEITYVANEMRQRASARSEDGRPVKQTAVVDVVKYAGNFYIVRSAK